MTTNQVFKALSDPTRREILRLLRSHEMTAGELAERFDMTKPTMSHHFSMLKDADLIISRRAGQTIWYGLNTTVLQDVVSWALDLTVPGRKTDSAKSNDSGKNNDSAKKNGGKR